MNWKLLIQQRNQLIMKIAWTFYLVETLFYFVIDPRFDTIWPPIGLVFCFLITLLVKYNLSEVFNMYVITSLIFSYLFYLNVSEPYLVNYIFIILGILLASLYENKKLILYATALSIGMFLYFYFTNGEHIFHAIDQLDIIYFVLFAILMMTFFLFHANYSNSLLMKLDKKEKRALSQLHSVEGLLSSFFDSTNDAIVVFDFHFHIKTMNQSFKSFYQTDSDLTEKVKSNLERYVNLYKTYKQEGKRVSGVELKDFRSDGKPLDVEVTISPVYNEQGDVTALSCVSRDIAERKISEELMINSEKLKIAGQMAAGIAHEIRNPLTVLHGYLKLIDGNKAMKPHYKDVMLKELNRVEQIINEFLHLSKPQPTSVTKCSINKLLHEVVILFEAECKVRNVSMELDFSDEDLYVNGVGNQLKQVFINFIKNALEASEHNGELLIETKRINSEEGQVVIKDTGIGMSDEIIEYIGQPFFTTKENGTGLGMMISQRIIDQHQGKLKIESEQGEGTTITIDLPLIK